MVRTKLLVATASLLTAVAARASDTNSWGWITFWSGAKIENPYNIAVSGHSATLTGAASSTDGYIELNLNTRFVVRSGQFDDIPAFGAPPSPPPPPTSIHFVAFWTEMPDIEAKTGYIFRGSASPTNFSVATIVGSADLYSDVSLGLPLLRYENASDPANIVKQQVSLEIGGGFVTDKSFLAVHPNVFIGPGWQGRFPAPNLTAQTLPAILTARVGLARIDEPRLLSGDHVALDALNNPVFDSAWVPSLGFESIYPINSAVNLQAGANVYFTSSPASWNLNLGLTLDLGKFFAVFSK